MLVMKRGCLPQRLQGGLIGFVVSIKLDGADFPVPASPGSISLDRLGMVWPAT